MLTVLRTLAAALASASMTLYGTAAPPIREQQQWVLSALNVEQAWTQSKGEGVTVAVVDSAVDPTVPELRGKVTVGPNMLSSTLARVDVEPGQHGTSMASLIAASGLDRSGADKGFVGVAPKARILSVPLVEDEDLGGDVIAPEDDLLASRESPLARAIRYAANHGAKVISMSIGTYGPQRSEREAVAYALGRGIVLVAAVGNDGATRYTKDHGTSFWSFPAGYPGVIGVSAVDRAGKGAAFSSDNMSVLVAAPGVDVPVAGRGGRYASSKGTSSSTALVAGVVALIKSRHPAMAPEQVAQALAGSTRSRPVAGYDDKLGFGVVDASAALNRADELAGLKRELAVPDDRHFGAGADSPVPSRPGPSPWRLWLFGGGTLLGLAAFSGAIMLLTQRNRRS